jgi:hypothetical protein
MGDLLVDLWGMIGRDSRVYRVVDHHAEEVVRSGRGYVEEIRVSTQGGKRIAGPICVSGG